MNWKDGSKRKPILLEGVRQIGKTWAMEEFGSRCFEHTAKFDFDRQPEPKAFKVYACDCGLLRKLARLPGSVVVDPTANYTEFKGAMAENAILQALTGICDDRVPYYWTSDGKAEIEFLIQYGNEIIPIEVKAENCVSGHSIAVYNDMYYPSNRIRYSFLNLQRNDGLLSCPAPLAEWSLGWLA